MVIGTHGHSSILLVGPMDISGHSSSSINLGGGSSWPIVDGGGCEERVVVMCDIMFVTSHMFTQLEFK